MNPAHADAAVATGRRERKRQQQKAHLAETAWALFEREGFDSVTMERIAEMADVSKVTLYKHFPVKEALLSHVFHQELREAWPVIQAELAHFAPGRARLLRFLQLQAAWCERRRPYLLPYTQYRLSAPRFPRRAEARSGMEQVFAELIAQGQASGSFRQTYSTALLTLHFQFAHLATLLRWLADDSQPLAEALAEMLALFCDGMGGADENT